MIQAVRKLQFMEVQLERVYPHSLGSMQFVDIFREKFPSDQSGYRTKKILDLVEAKIAKLVPDQDAEKLARTALENAGLKLKRKREKMKMDAK